MAHKPLKTITSHVGYARFLREVEDTDLEIPRIAGIPSPYAYSPTWPVYLWHDRQVVIRETSHKRYQVFAIPQGVTATQIKSGAECLAQAADAAEMA